jgi:hypothetical protein
MAVPSIGWRDAGGVTYGSPGGMREIPARTTRSADAGNLTGEGTDYWDSLVWKEWWQWRCVAMLCRPLVCVILAGAPAPAWAHGIHVGSESASGFV